MHKVHDGIPEHEAQRRRRRRNVDSEQESIRARMAGPGRTEPGGHKGHATGGIRDEGEEGGGTADQPEHGIRPSAQEMHRLLTIAPRRTGEVVANVERAGSAGTDQKHKFLVTKIRQGHGVSSRSVPQAPLSLHAVPAGGLQ